MLWCACPLRWLCVCVYMWCCVYMVVLCVHVVLCVSLFLHVSLSFLFHCTHRDEIRQTSDLYQLRTAMHHAILYQERSYRHTTHSFEHRHTRTALNKHTNTTNQEHQIFTTPTAKKQHTNSHAKHTHTNTDTNTTTQKQTRNKRNQQRHTHAQKPQYKP